jgi:hypothetical protein
MRAKTATIHCLNCGSANRAAIARYGNGQGEVDLATVTCAAKGCGKELCPACGREECSQCEKTFCCDHVTRVLSMCQECVEDLEAKLTCTCERTDVDRYDARGCDEHDPSSDWRRAMAHFDRLTAIAEQAAEPERECPFDDPELVPVVMEMDLAARLRASLKQVGAA